MSDDAGLPVWHLTEPIQSGKRLQLHRKVISKVCLVQISREALCERLQWGNACSLVSVRDGGTESWGNRRPQGPQEI